MPGSGVGVCADGAALASASGSGPPAARRLDEALARVARAEWQVDRELARGLALLWDREHYRPLGFVRATDFVREEVGIQESRARWLARLGRQLRAVPELDQALGEGRISASKAIELGRVLGPGSTEEERRSWIERASRMGVRALRREVQAEKRRQGEEGDAVGPADPDEVPAGSWMSIPAPARVGVLWEGAVELARISAGRHLTQGQAAELIFAEYLSGVGPEVSEVRADTGPPVDRERERLVAEVIAALNREADQVGRKRRKVGMPDEVVRAAELQAPDATVERTLEALPPPELSPDCIVDESADAWGVADTLKRLTGLKRRLRYELAGLLAAFLQEAHPAQLGFPTMEAYCVERLGFGLRRAERLVRFHSGLAQFPRLASAYLAGRVSYTAALLLLPILHRTTEAAWVEWAYGITYRELERVVEHARTYSLPEASPIVIESYARELEAQGMARRESETEGATAFAAAGATAFPAGVPLGCALPPEPGGLPRITGLPDDLLLAEPERCVARIRFWLPDDAMELAHRALDRCRLTLADPLLRTWVYIEVILVHFIHTHDTKEARKLERRHRIIARDNYRCLFPGCMSRMHFEGHHVRPRAQGGTNHDWNQATGCFGHHRHGVHAGAIEMGGFAPDRLTFRIGINPKTGRALACYRNDRRVTEEDAVADLARWRAFWRDHRAGDGDEAVAKVLAEIAAHDRKGGNILQLA